MPSSANDPKTLYRLCRAAQKGDLKTFQALLETSANPNQAYQNVNAFCLAVQYGHIKIVELILDKKISPNERSPTGTTPLYLAALAGNESMATLLLNHDANPNQACLNGTYPIMVAAQKHHTAIVALLESKGAISIRAIVLEAITKELQQRDILIPYRVFAIKKLSDYEMLEQSKERFKQALKQFNELDTYANLLNSISNTYKPDNENRIKNLAALKDEINNAYKAFSEGKEMVAIIANLKVKARNIATDAQRNHVATSTLGTFGVTHSKLEQFILDALDTAEHKRIISNFL